METKSNLPSPHKRLVVLCDGTWMDSDIGYNKPTLWRQQGSMQIPSNVTRMSRFLKLRCSDGTIQVVDYQSGVGTGGGFLDDLTGGAFGTGIAEHIRQAYAFICSNYADGDEIILVGFSRGAFTARSVAGMIGDLGILTRTGMEYFYPIFKDHENWQTPNYKDPFPSVPFSNKPRGKDAAEKYRNMLIQRGYTRAYQDNNKGEPIKIKAVAVWDTVGSLGIPNVSWLSKLGFNGSSKEYRFYNTDLSEKIEYAFQALALDEHRTPFSPAVWERTSNNHDQTELRQAWFPGNHGNVGGGWADQGIANISFIWMMDQLASVGVEFDESTIGRLYTDTKHFYSGASGAKNTVSSSTAADKGSWSDEESVSGDSAGCSSWLPLFKCRPLQWAMNPIYSNNTPIRPWGLGKMYRAGGLVFKLAGSINRTPGMYKKVNQFTGKPVNAWLEDTNERIHSSVRVRLVLQGLGLDDKAPWDCPALRKNWRLCRASQLAANSTLAQPAQGNTSQTALKGAASGELLVQSTVTVATSAVQDSWVWQYVGDESKAPPRRVMLEDSLGRYETEFLKLAAGDPDVFEFAESTLSDA